MILVSAGTAMVQPERYDDNGDERAGSFANRLLMGI